MPIDTPELTDYARVTSVFWDEGDEGFRDLWRRGGAGAGLPPFKSALTAFAARSRRVQYTGRKRRSCSPVCL